MTPDEIRAIKRALSPGGDKPRLAPSPETVRRLCTEVERCWAEIDRLNEVITDTGREWMRP